MKVSVVILTFNEERNIVRCLDSLSWCDDVVVVDSGSSDRTVELATAKGARVIGRAFDNFAGQRNFALDSASFRHDWILHLDADEAITEPFKAKLSELAPPEGIFAYRVPSKLMFMGRWIRRSSMYPVYQVRLGRLGHFRFRQLGHGQVEAIPPVHIGVFDEPYLHYGFSKGMADWLTKHVRYAEDEAREALQSAAVERSAISDRYQRRRFLKRLSYRLPAFSRPFLRFVYVYVLRLGFLDGRPGLIYAMMLSTYELMFSLMLVDLKERPSLRSETERPDPAS